MGDLFALLHDIKSAGAEMEFCEDFNKLQLILNTTNQYIRPFDKIVFYSGNESYIIEVVARLLRYLRVQNYLDHDNKVNRQFEPELRRITMYMLLNTDVNFRYDLEQDPRVNHLLNSLPQLTKCLLMNCIWGLDLDRFFYEMLRYAPLWFSMQFVDQAIVSLKYGKPYEVLERIESMVSAIYFAMCRTDVDLRRINRNRYVDQQRTLARLYDYVVEMLQYFSAPEPSKFDGWSKLRKHRYFGFVLKHMFSMTMACLDLYFRKPAIPIDPAMSVYQLMDDQHVHKPAPVEYTQATEATLLKINHHLLNTLEQCLMHVSLAQFCYWAEIDLFQEGEEKVTLQQVIGEAAYRLCEDLKSHRHFRHSIVRHLTQFALRPKTFAEKAASLNLGTLMVRIERAATDEERLAYLEEFLNRPEWVFVNAECLETLEQHLRLLNGEHVRLMIEYESREPVDDGLEVDSEEDLTDERAKLRELILRVVDVLPAPEFERLFSYTLRKFGSEFDRYERTDLAPAIIQLLNRVAEPANPQQSPSAGPNVQQLLFQSPVKFFNRLVQTIYNAAMGRPKTCLVDAIIEIIVRYKTFAKPYMQPHMSALVKGEFDVCRSPVLREFAAKLFMGGVFTGYDFFHNYLMDGFYEASHNRNQLALYELMQLYGDIVPWCWVNYTDDNQTIPDERKRQLMLKVLRNLGYILQTHRYRVMVDNKKLEPVPDRMVLVSLGLDLLIRTLQEVHKQLNNEEKEEILNELKLDMDDSTMYYVLQHVRTVMSPPKDDEFGDLLEEMANGVEAPKEKAPQPTEYGAFLYRCYVKPTAEDKEVTAYLLNVFPRCILPEALALARHKRFGTYFPMLGELGLVTFFNTSKHAGVMRHCTSNYIQCLLQVMLPNEVARGRGTEACQKLVRIVLRLLQTFVPGDNRLQARVALDGDVAALYRYVRKVAPTIPELDQLEASLLYDVDKQNDVEEKGEQVDEKMEQVDEKMDEACTNVAHTEENIEQKAEMVGEQKDQKRELEVTFDQKEETEEIREDTVQVQETIEEKEQLENVKENRELVEEKMESTEETVENVEDNTALKEPVEEKVEAGQEKLEELEEKMEEKTKVQDDVEEMDTNEHEEKKP